MTTLAEMLMGKVVPPDGEVVDRGAFLPLGTYRRPDGTETTSLAFPQAARDGLDALAYALGYRQDPNAPGGYVTQDALNRGGQGLAESAMVGSLAARAPAGALRSGGGGRSGDDMMRRMMELNDAADAEMARRRAEGPKQLTPEQQAQLDEIERLKQAFAKRDPSAARNQADPQAMAAALDPSPAARLARAREMGFDTDTTLYHGTPHEFSSFEAKSTPGWEQDGAGVSFDRSASVASGYARQRAGLDETGTRVIPAYVRGRMAPLDLWQQKLAETGSPDAAQQELTSMGYAGVARPTANMGRGKVTGEVRVFDPRNIRSVNAMFDPAKSDSANLLAANPMAGAVPLMFDDPDQRRQMIARHLMQGGA